MIPDDHPWRDAEGNLQCQGCGEAPARLTGDGLCRACDEANPIPDEGGDRG